MKSRQRSAWCCRPTSQDAVLLKPGSKVQMPCLQHTHTLVFDLFLMMSTSNCRLSSLDAPPNIQEVAPHAEENWSSSPIVQFPDVDKLLPCRIRHVRQLDLRTAVYLSSGDMASRRIGAKPGSSKTTASRPVSSRRSKRFCVSFYINPFCDVLRVDCRADWQSNSTAVTVRLQLLLHKCCNKLARTWPLVPTSELLFNVQHSEHSNSSVHSTNDDTFTRRCSGAVIRTTSQPAPSQQAAMPL